MEARFTPTHHSAWACYQRCLAVAVCLWAAGFPALVSSGAEPATTHAPRTALVIGNGRYEPAIGPLRNTTNDAKAVAKTLRSLGFAVMEKQDVTRDQLLKAMLEFRRTLASAEVGLFYYAGHGISVAGANYLIPLKSAFSAEGADDITLRMLAETRLLNVEQIVADMAASGAKCNLIILDACRTNTLARTGRTRDALNHGGLSEMTPPAGSLIAFATDAGQTAQDGEGVNGLYTEELLKNLRTPSLTIEQVFKRTRAGVLERSNGAQIPAEYSRLIGDDIFLAGQFPIAQLAEPTPPAPAAGATLEPAPTLATINKLAAAGRVEACLKGLQLQSLSQGPGDYAAAPLSLLLDKVRDDLKDLTEATPAVTAAAAACELILRALPDCLPQQHPLAPQLTAKAHNRHGDALLLLGRVDEALEDFNAALPLTPEDAYILYNRARAHEALGNTEAARADFTAASTQTRQPKARKLAQQALSKMK